MYGVALALVLIATAVDAQTSVRAATLFLSGPNGRELATLRAGAVVRVATGGAATRQGHTQVTLDGYIDASLLGPGRDSFPNVVKAPSGARLRSSGSTTASILADLRDGMGVAVISRAGSWVRVRRTAWVASSALTTSPQQSSGASRDAPAAPPAGRGSTTPAGGRGAAAGGAAAAQAADSLARPGETPAVQSAEQAPPGAFRAASAAELRTAPDGRALASLDSGALLVPLARGGGWTRVRIEGWVRDDQLIPADSALQLSLSGADLRAAPERYRGAVVRWEVEFISVQKADPLRPDLRAGEPYMLARGPLTESGLLYVAVPPALLPEIERLRPLDVLRITARVRVGRSEPAGVPVLDLIAAARK